MEVPKIEVSLDIPQEPMPAHQNVNVTLKQQNLDKSLPLQSFVKCQKEISIPIEVPAETTNEANTKECGKTEIEDICECTVSGEMIGSGDVQNAVPSISRSISDRTCCRICQEDDTHEKLISPCYCTGSVGCMHISCLEKWLQINARTNCELCSYAFPVEKVFPTVWKHCRHPSQNMDLPSLLCDVSCFFLLTPLLIASMYLCSVGVTYYQIAGKTESVFAVVTLMISLITVYLAWGFLAILYHRRVWFTWRDKNAQIRMQTDPKESNVPRNTASKVELGDDSLASSDTFRISSRQERTSALLRPFLILTKNRMLRVHNSMHSL